MIFILFLILRTTLNLNWDKDVYFACLILAIEFPQYLRILVYLIKR